MVLPAVRSKGFRQEIKESFREIPACRSRQWFFGGRSPGRFSRLFPPSYCGRVVSSLKVAKKGLEFRVVNIVLLTNQERLLRLFNSSGVQQAGKVRVAGAIHEVLPLVSPQGQNLIFIQERLGEMSGELIAYRIGSEVRGKKVRIVLFGDSETIPLSGRKPFQAVLDTSLSDSELTLAILDIVSLPAAGTRKKKVSVKNKLSLQAGERKSAETEPPNLTERVNDVVQIQGAAPYLTQDSSPREVLPVSDASKMSFQAQLESALSDANGASIAPRREMPLVAPDPFAGPLRVTWGKPTFRERLRQRFRQPRRFLLLGVACACFLALIVMFSVYQQNPDKSAVVPGASPVTPGATEQDASPAFQNLPGALPAFLPRQAADSAYSKANPGWERYQGPLTEFRIFREKGLIRALQIIDRSGQGISPALLSTVLTEMAGGRQYVVETTEQKGTYVVEKGSVLTGDRIIVYRKEPERSVKAFVLDLK